MGEAQTGGCPGLRDARSGWRGSTRPSTAAQQHLTHQRWKTELRAPCLCSSSTVEKPLQHELHRLGLLTGPSGKPSLSGTSSKRQSRGLQRVPPHHAPRFTLSVRRPPAWTEQLPDERGWDGRTNNHPKLTCEGREEGARGPLGPPAIRSGGPALPPPCPPTAWPHTSGNIARALEILKSKQMFILISRQTVS